MKTAQLCSEINGGDCKNKVSARNGYVCAAGHGKEANKREGAIGPLAISFISKMNQSEQESLARKTPNSALQWELFYTMDKYVQWRLTQNPALVEDLQWEIARESERDIQSSLFLNPNLVEGIQREVFSTNDEYKQRPLAQNPALVEDLQWSVFHTNSWYLQEGLAQNPSIGEDLQWELFRTDNWRIREQLSLNPALVEDLQWELFRTGNWLNLRGLAQNPSIDEKLQLELFHTRGKDVTRELTQNLSISRDLAIEISKTQIPISYVKGKALATLLEPENLALLNQHPTAFAAAYLERLLSNSQEGKEESKALILHSYLIYEKSGGVSAEQYKSKIIKRYKNDREVALILGETAQ